MNSALAMVCAVGLDDAADKSVDLMVNGSAASLSGQLAGISEQYLVSP